jgi:hypothetical protein
MVLENQAIEELVALENVADRSLRRPVGRAAYLVADEDQSDSLAELAQSISCRP